MSRPYVTCSIAVSLDGRIDDSSPEALKLSNAQDFALIDELRAAQDAILVGAETVRRDNPRLVLRAPELSKARLEAGKIASPVKVTLTRSGNLDPSSAFATLGDSPKLIYCPQLCAERLSRAFAGRAEVVPALGDDVTPSFLLEDLGRRGVERLLIEGGQRIHTLFFEAGLVDELRYAVAPFFVGEKAAPQFVSEGQFPFNKNRRMTLIGVQQVGDVAVMNYRLR